jgi:3-hydroxymyristoyl/3-hydroxydecanoyl-(acyl carrier protein) dehydratase/1-acyl-sn-glycerol-3-phosphate acyltransferase
VAAATLPQGPRFSRAQLETLASGSIAAVLGQVFAAQEEFHRQVRMPMPPLLLADRVIGLAGEPGSHGTGTIWTETDVTANAWYLHHGRMPAGITIEAGQADLLLCSWLGADLKNQGERVYRLLGCDLIYHDTLPGIGETLTYEIHITGHAELGGVRLFFFHSDCRSDGQLVMSVRNGQAGFFTDAELANSEGVLWRPEAPEHQPGPGGVAACPVVTTRRAFDAEAVRQFAAGALLDCFGTGFEVGAVHTRSPGIPQDRMRLFDTVPGFEPGGGPWGRGYLRAERRIARDDWFFAGHFLNDPCMPGTLMFDGCLQAMAFYMAAHGLTLQRDGWRFEPMVGEVFKLRCRGQVTPQSQLLLTEVFVRELVAGPHPVLRCDLLCTVDGKRAFHAANVALRLVPGWPADLSAPPPKLPDGRVDIFSAESVLASALGRPSFAMGVDGVRFEGPLRGPRLPGPPYHFITRILASDHDRGMVSGVYVRTLYDIPPDAWYFDANGARTMPFAILLEAVLQPCGWLATAMGCPLSAEGEIFFRNLDGTATQLHELLPDAGALITHAKVTSLSVLGAMILVSFDVSCEAGGRTVLTMQTGFGFFPEAALANQVGLPVTPADQALLARADELGLELGSLPAELFAGPARLAGAPLLMLERITGHWPGEGKAGLGLIRGEKRVEPREWFFKAHFSCDPVQPGSLGIEALLQLLQAHMLRTGMAEGLRAPYFEPLALELPSTWKYRGQVVPKDKVITSTVEVLETGRDARGVVAVATGTLYVDGRKIYHLPRFGMRLVEAAPAVPASHAEEFVLDPAADRWLADHCPSIVIPAVPMMMTVDLLAGAAARVAGARKVVELRHVKVRGWIAFPDGPRRLRLEAETLAPNGGAPDRVAMRLLIWRDAPRAEMSRFDLVATGEARLADAWPEPPAPLPSFEGGEVIHGSYRGQQRDFYAEGDMFHGPSMQHVRQVRWDVAQGHAVLDADPGAVPSRLLNPLLLDCAVQAIVGDSIGRVDPTLPADAVGFPAEVVSIRLFGPTPMAGEVACEMRYRGRHHEDERLLHMTMQLTREGRVWADIDMTEVAFRNIPPTSVPRIDRTRIKGPVRPLKDAYVVRPEGGITRATNAAIAAGDWFPNTVATIYGLPPQDRSVLRTMVAVKDHLGPDWELHPASILLAADGRTAWSPARPFLRRALNILPDAEGTTVSDAGPDELDRAALLAFWHGGADGPGNPAAALTIELCTRFIRQVRLEDPAAVAALRGKPVLLLGNHQTYVESVLAANLLGPLLGERIAFVSRVEHQPEQGHWIGGIMAQRELWPGASQHDAMLYFDRADPADMLRLLADYRTRLLPQGRSLFVHVDGEVALSCRSQVAQLSAVLLDLACEAGLPVLPVRFTGGLPVTPLAAPSHFPLGYGRQDIRVGAPITPEQLRAVPLVERKRLVLAAINGIEPRAEEEAPLPPAPEFAARVAARRQRGMGEVGAVLQEVLADLAAREPGWAPLAAGQVPADWDAHQAAWGRGFLAWLAGQG